jgi:hypothetical protein
MDIAVLGLHPVPDADQPCHLVELKVSNYRGVLDLSTIRVPHPQGKAGLEQVPWLTHVLNKTGSNGSELYAENPVVKGECRLAFFIFYLAEMWKLESPVGPLQLPKETPIPRRLRFMKYVPVD